MMTLVPALAFAATVDNTGVTFTVQADGSVKVTATTAGHKVASADTATGAADADGANEIVIAADSVESNNKYYGAGAAIDKTNGSDTFTNAVQIDTDTKAVAAAVKVYATYKNAANTAKVAALNTAATDNAITSLNVANGNKFAAITGVTVTDLIALNAETQTIARASYTAGSIANADAHAAFAKAYNALSSNAKTIVDNDTTEGAKVTAYKAVVSVMDAWNAYKADSKNETKLLNYKTAYLLAGADAQDDFATILGAKEAAVATAVKDADITTAAALVATLSGGSGSGGITPPSATGVASVDASILATVDSNVTIEVNSGATTGNVANWIDTKYAELDLVFRANNNAAANPPSSVYIWAEESGKSKQATDAFVLSGATRQIALTNGGYVYEFTSGLNSSNTLKAAFVRGGTYTIKGSFVDPVVAGDATLKDVAVLKSVSGKTTITANALAQETRLFKLTVGQGDEKSNIDTLLQDGEKTDRNVTVAANTVATTKVTLTVYNKDNSLMTTYPVKLSTNSGNIELDKTAVTTDYKGEATFNVAGLREGEYKVYVNIGDYEATIMVTVGATSANNIELIKFPSNPIATDTMVSDYKDVFRFQLTDANGNIVKDTYKGAEYAAITATDGTSTTEQAKYASIVSAPEANKVKNADLKLKYVSGKDYYTLDVDNNKSFSAEGDYEIRVVLNNGKSATLNFTVKKFDTAVSLHIEYPTQAVELNSKTDAPDIYFLDANNVMKKANNRVTVAASGYAVAGIVESGSDAGTLTVKNDEKYIGQTITVTAASDKENLMATTTLTVADEAREVKLDTTKGQVNANNRVGFKVVDSTGKAVALGNDATVDVTAVVQNTGDADAKVSYSVSSSSKSDLKSNGTGVINLSSNKETTATVQIMVKVSKPLTNANDNNTGLSTTYYTGTETYTFGAEADKSVVMTIGSKEMVANNVPVTTDVAPFIQDNRTYVPFRALTEAFGAEVEYNAENNTVTTKLNGKTVVLTVGSTVLTVNDNTVTMDVAPFIVDDRVVVPVRFIGEAFGFTVEATQDATTGATASVVFYQK